MGTTQGFELVAEVQQSFLLQVLQAAWDSSIIPHSTPTPANTSFGPYQIAKGVVNIPRDGLALNMVPAQNSVQIVLGNTQIQAQIANPPVPSVSMFNMQANIAVTVPVGTLPGTINVGLIIAGLPRANVSVVLTSGDPIGPITLNMIQDYVDAQYSNKTIPHAFGPKNESFGEFTANAYATIDNDPTDPSNQIVASQPAANEVEVSVPVHLKLTDVVATLSGTNVPSPIGVETRVDLTAPLTIAPGSISANLTTAQSSVEAIAADPSVQNNAYQTDKTLAQGIGVNLDSVLQNGIQSYVPQIAAGIGNISIVVPTLAQIETYIGDQVYQAILSGGDIGVWTPQTGGNTQITIQNVQPQVLSDALAIGINAESGANASALTNFIPTGREFALAFDGSLVLSLVQQAIDKPQSQGGLGGVPTTLQNVGGHTVNLNDLTTTLQEGSIHFSGDCTVVNAIAGHIDVDASFTADAGMTWVNNADGTQAIQPVDLGSDVSLGVLGWIIALLTGFIAGGLIGGIIAIVVMEVATGIANRVGGALAQNDITKQVTGIGAWPQTLEDENAQNQVRTIGTVSASFQNPIDIHADCVIFSG